LYGRSEASTNCRSSRDPSIQERSWKYAGWFHARYILLLVFIQWRRLVVPALAA